MAVLVYYKKEHQMILSAQLQVSKTDVVPWNVLILSLKENKKNAHFQFLLSFGASFILKRYFVP